jgi:hypothetical protein
MRLRSFVSHWRKFVATLATICILAAAGFAIWFVWKLKHVEDKFGEVGFSNDASLMLHRKSPGGVSYTINNSEATFGLDIAPDDKNCQRLFPNYAAALKFARQTALPTTASVQMIHGKCKQFDDELCAALEQAVQTGNQQIPGKAAALRQLATKLAAAREAAPAQARPAIERALIYVATAVALGGGDVPLDPALASQVDAGKSAFLAVTAESSPAGIWSQSPALRGIFLQDRFLMKGIALEDDPAACMALARVIASDPGLARAFDLFREFDAKLTNRPVFVRQDVSFAVPAYALSFREIDSVTPQGVPLADLLTPEKVRATQAALSQSYGTDAGFALIDYAESPEYGIMLQAAVEGQGRSVSLQTIVDAIRQGRISLAPKQGSGWYDYQWYALETLLLPGRAAESTKLVMSAAYKKRLEEAFKSSLAKDRDTHIKQLPRLGMGMKEDKPAPVVEVHPEFSAEPVATLYLREARAYRFLHTALASVLGAEALKSLHRAPAANAEAPGLDEELRRMALLCYGVYHTVSVEMGLVPSYLQGEITPAELDEAKSIAAQWLADPGADPDLARDARIAAPVAASPQGSVAYWATGGIRFQRVKYEYKREPVVGPEVKPVFVPTYYYLPTDVTLEFARTGSLTREEFRKLCDSCADEASLRRLLHAPDHSPGQFSKIAWTSAILIGTGGLLLLAWMLLRRLSRRAFIAGFAAVIVLCSAWSARMVFDLNYRTRFLIKEIASRNMILASIYEARVVLPYQWADDGSPKFMRSLAGLLNDPDPEVQYLAMEYLGPFHLNKVEGADVVETLRKIAAESDPVLSPMAFSYLGAFHDDRTVAFLLAKIRDTGSNPKERAAAILGLSKEDPDPRMIEVVLACSRESNREMQFAAALFLAAYDDPRCIDRIVEMLQSSDQNLSRVGLWAWERFRSENSKHDVSARMDPILLEAARNTAFGARFRAHLADVIHDQPMRILALESLLTNPSMESNRESLESRHAAAWRLEDIKSAAQTAIPIMKAILADAGTDPRARQDLEDAIAKLQKK